MHLSVEKETSKNKYHYFCCRMFVYHLCTHSSFLYASDGKVIKAPLSLNLYVSYLHTTHIQTTSFARPLARQCVLVVVGTTEWECGEAFSKQSACSPIATLLRHYICVDRYAFPLFRYTVSVRVAEMENSAFPIQSYFHHLCSWFVDRPRNFFPFQAKTNNDLPTDPKKN